MNSYELKITIDGIEYIEATSEDGIVSFIPADPANSDYQAYLNKDNPDFNTQPTL